MTRTMMRATFDDGIQSDCDSICESVNRGAMSRRSVTSEKSEDVRKLMLSVRPIHLTHLTRSVRSWSGSDLSSAFLTFSDELSGASESGFT